MNDVRLPPCVRLSELKAALNLLHGDRDPEMFVGVEGGRAFLYAVQRQDGPCSGKVILWRELPLLPGEDQ